MFFTSGKKWSKNGAFVFSFVLCYNEAGNIKNTSRKEWNI